MLELNLNKKNKVNLSDYNYQRDVENRSLIADLSFFEYEVLQEIFFSPTKFSKLKFAKTLEVEEKTLSPVFEKLAHTGLLSLEGEIVLVDKDMRKFFEFHMRRFEPDFRCDMEYLQGILRQVPIHILPLWYSIPRTSNNIFESIVEKYLLTPQLFQRYLSELTFSNPIANEVIQDVFNSDDFRISSSDIIAKYNLSRQEFEELLLTLELSFVLCVNYTRGDDLWIEWVTPFYEWHEYLRFLKNTTVSPINPLNRIETDQRGTFPYVRGLCSTLQKIKNGSSEPLPQEHLDKLLLLELIEKSRSEIKLLSSAENFLDLDSEKQAIYLFRHPYNQVKNPSFPRELSTEKNIREVEKSLRRVIGLGWVFFDDFYRGSLVSFNDMHSILLQKHGKSWKYDLPSHSETERMFIKLIIFEWLFEAGIVDTGICEGRECFKVTSFGCALFEE